MPFRGPLSSSPWAKQLQTRPLQLILLVAVGLLVLMKVASLFSSGYAASATARGASRASALLRQRALEEDREALGLSREVPNDRPSDPRVLWSRLGLGPWFQEDAPLEVEGRRSSEGAAAVETQTKQKQKEDSPPAVAMFDPPTELLPMSTKQLKPLPLQGAKPAKAKAPAATRTTKTKLKPAAGAGASSSAASAPTFKDPTAFPVDVPDSAQTIQNEDAANLHRLQRTYADPSLEPSQAFKDAWERYKQSHNRYTAAMRENKAKDAVTASGLKGSIVVSPAGQLANRVMASVSAFLLGLLGDRAVYLAFQGSYYASLSDLFEDPGIAWDSDVALRDMKIDATGNLVLPLAEPYPLSQELIDDLSCNNLKTEGLGAKNVAEGGQVHISIASNQYFVPFLANNPQHKAKVDELFPDGDIFGTLARALFRPSKAVLALKDAWKKEIKWDERYVVGLQVRTGGDFTDQPFGQQDWDLLLGCGELMLALEKSLAHPAITGGDSTSNEQLRSKKAAIFVATDIEWSRDAALTQLARTGLEVLEFGTFMRSNNPRGCQQALVDILLLSESNDLLTTPWSTFGYFAVGLTRKRPTMLTKIMPSSILTTTAHEELDASGEMTYSGVPMHIDARTGCARLPTSEPCFHFLPKYHAEKGKCYDAKENPWLEKEFRGGRYC